MLHAQHTFFEHYFAVVLHDYNEKLPGYTFHGGNNVRVLVHFLSLPLIFTLVARSISHFLTTVTKFSCCSTNKNVSFFFLLL